MAVYSSLRRSNRLQGVTTITEEVDNGLQCIYKPLSWDRPGYQRRKAISDFPRSADVGGLVSAFGWCSGIDNAGVSLLVGLGRNGGNNTLVTSRRASKRAFGRTGPSVPPSGDHEAACAGNMGQGVG